MFKKINKNWIVEWQKLKILEKVHNPLGNEGLNYHNIDNLSKKVYVNCLPKAIQDYASVRYVSMQGPFTIHAHKDTGCKTAINYYIESGHAITRFYDATNAKEITNYLGYNVRQAYDRETLSFLGSFNASDKDVWIINTQIVHDVCQPLPTQRKFIQWAFNLPWEDVVCHFE